MTGARLRPLGAADLPQVAAIVDARRPGAGDAWLRRMSWQTRNPFQGSHPIGFGLETESGIAGYHFLIGQPMWIGGAVAGALFALDLFVAPELRGTLHSLALTRSVFSLAGRPPILTTTANPISEALWTQLGARRLPGGETSLVRFFWSLRLAAGAVERILPGLPVRAAAAPAPPPGPAAAGPGWSSEPLAADDPQPARLWADVRPQYPLATERSREFLAWRYAPDSPGGVLVGMRDRRGALRAWYVYRLGERGGRAKVRLFAVLDVVAAPEDREALAAVARDLVGRARAARADVLEARGLRREVREALRTGARLRDRRLPANPFLARMQPSAEPSEAWHLVSGDGDGGFV